MLLPPTQSLGGKLPPLSDPGVRAPRPSSLRRGVQAHSPAVCQEPRGLKIRLWRWIKSDTWKRLVRTQEGGGESESAPSSIRLRPAGTQATHPPAAGLAPNAHPGSASRAPSQPGRGSGLEPREVLEVTPGNPSPIPKLRGREWREAGESARPRAGGGVSDLNPAAAGEGRGADRREGPGRWLRGRTARPRAASPSLIRASSQRSHLECGGDPGGGRRGGAGTSAPPPASGRARPARGSWERKVHLGREARSLNFCVLQNVSSGSPEQGLEAWTHEGL